MALVLRFFRGFLLASALSGTLAAAETAHAADGDPVVSIYSGQQHVFYRAAGTIWDYFNNGGTWSLQQINAGGLTIAPAAASDPNVTIFGSQLHVTYRDAAGTIWDSYYDGRHWLSQQINAGDSTTGPAAAGNPFASVFFNQFHVFYRDAAGTIWDSYNDGSTWHSQQINAAGGLTAGPAAAGDPFTSVYSDQQHDFYRDAAGKIWDSWYGTRWQSQQINAGGLTTAPAAAGDPFPSVYSGQQHDFYRDAAGKIWDSWYDGNWHSQQINVGGLTTAPAAAGDLFVAVFSNASTRPATNAASEQQHVVYRDTAGTVWDAYYDGSAWHSQQINVGGLTTAPAAAGDPVFSAYSTRCSSGPSSIPCLQLNVLYQDANGMIWDVSNYNGGSWQAQPLHQIASEGQPD